MEKHPYKNNISFSRLKNLRKDFRQFEIDMNKPKSADKKEPSIGALFHWALLEPQKFINVHPYLPFEKRKNADKERYKKMCRDYMFLATYDNYNLVRKLKARFLKDSRIKNIVETSRKEVYVKSVIDGYNVSGQIDLLQPDSFGVGYIYDTKTLHYEDFNKAYKMTGSGMQAAIYSLLIESIGFEFGGFWFIHYDHNFDPFFRPMDDYDMYKARKDFLNALKYITFMRSLKENGNSYPAPRYIPKFNKYE